MVAITEDRLTVGRADMAWCRDLSGEIEHASGGTASMLWASEQQNNKLLTLPRKVRQRDLSGVLQTL